MACLASLLVASPARAVFFNPPSSQTPSSLGGNSRRGGCAADEVALSEDERLVSFLPIVPDPTEVVALTTKAAPSMWVYVPPTSAQTVEFALLDSVAGEYIYLASFPIATSGLYRIDLPADMELKADRPDAPQDYIWFLDLVCDPGRPEENLSTTGTLKRVPTDADAALENGLDDAPDAIERAKAYGESGVWVDMVAEVSAARETETDAPTGESTEFWNGIFDVALPVAEREDVDRAEQLDRLTSADVFVADLTSLLE